MPPEPALCPGPSLGELLEAAADRLRAAGVPAARREAIRIAADVLGLLPGEAPLRADRRPDGPATRRFRAAVERRAAGEPLAYATGLAGFRLLTLVVDRRVLIPRPETEGLVERVLRTAPGGMAIDVGTGSGCIALSLRQEGRYRRVLGVDRSAGALAVARANRERLGLDVLLVRGDLVEAVGDSVADVLVANPPYLSAAEYRELDPSVRDHEPRLALESGADGLEATGRLLAAGLRVARPGGLLALELDAGRAGPTAELARARGWSDVRIEEDPYGRARYLLARRRAS